MKTRLEGAELLKYVMNVSRRMAEERELEPLLSYAIDEVLQLVGAERGYIILGRPEGKLDIKVKRNKEGKDLKQGADELSTSIISEVVNTGQSLVLRNAMENPRFSEAKSVMYLRLRSIMCVPLITRNNTIGAIYVENRSVRGRFDEADLPPLELFANQTAVSIENASLIEDLEGANRDLRQLDELKSNFIILISHELRTPLTSVTAYAQLMKDAIERVDPSPDPQVVLIREKLEDAVLRMGKTIEEIILVFRLSSGQLNLTRHEAYLQSIIEMVLNGLKDVCSERNLTVQVEHSDELPALFLDARRIKVVLSNVIGNAVKFTPNGGQITVRTGTRGNNVEIAVCDSGIGIPIEEQGRIFDLFRVLGSLMHHSSSKSAYQGGGLGLGLPIAKGIVEAHNGSIRIESPGHDPEKLPGTTCTITLPNVNPSFD